MCWLPAATASSALTPPPHWREPCALTRSRNRIADAIRLPLADGAADLAVAHMSLQDVDDLEGAVAEIAPGSCGHVVDCARPWWHAETVDKVGSR